nr:hypothetical protein [Spirochaetales bacterium]
VTYIAEPYGYSVFDTSMVLRWRPSPINLWFGISLFQGVSIHGEGRPVNWYHHMNELKAGYTFPITDWLFIEPMVTVRDPGSIFKESLDMVSEYVEGYSRLRFCLNLGVIGLPLGHSN